MPNLNCIYEQSANGQNVMLYDCFTYAKSYNTVAIMNTLHYIFTRVITFKIIVKV